MRTADLLKKAETFEEQREWASDVKTLVSMLDWFNDVMYLANHVEGLKSEITDPSGTDEDLEKSYIVILKYTAMEKEGPTSVWKLSIYERLLEAGTAMDMHIILGKEYSNIINRLNHVASQAEHVIKTLVQLTAASTDLLAAVQGTKLMQRLVDKVKPT